MTKICHDYTRKRDELYAYKVAGENQQFIEENKNDWLKFHGYVIQERLTIYV